MNDKGFAVVGSAVIIALAVFMGFGAAVIVQRGHLLHQARLTQQRISRSAHEGLTVSVNRGSDSTDITIANDGSSTVVFNHLLLRQPDNRVVAMPSSDGFFNDLAGWWRFSEGAGDTAYDYSGNGNDGTLYGDPTWVDGQLGDGALEFDGTDDYISSSYTYTDNPITLSAWARVDGGTEGSVLFMNPFAIGIWQQAGKIWLGLWTSSGQHNVYLFSYDSQWHHYTITYDGSVARAYVDAKLKNSLVLNEDLRDIAEFYMGGKKPNNWFLDGSVDEATIYDRALSPGEISELSKYNVLLYPVSLAPLESYTVTYPFSIDNHATVGVYTQLGNMFWEEVS